MTDERHQPYVSEDPEQIEDIQDLVRYVANEFRRIERAFNGVDLDVETRWGNASVQGSSGYIRLPPSFKQYSVIKPSATVLYSDGSTAGARSVYTLTRRVFNSNETAGAVVSESITATAHPDYCRRIEFSDITASLAAIDSYVQVSVGVTHQDLDATAPTVLSVDVRYEMDALGSEQEYYKA